ncbi:MAG: NAD(P)/FAD-dependent oxidoreductase [Planctomycetota bacterium]
MRIRRLPNDDQSCGWHAILPPLEPARRLTAEQQADWVVLGAGFTGLATAHRLAEHHPQARVILLDAQRVGFGASGRNSGFIVDIGHYQERLDLEGNQRLVRVARAGVDRLRELVHRHAIDCQWSEPGRLHGAVGDIGVHHLEHLCRRLDQMGEPYKALDSKALSAITGTTYYRAGVHTPGVVMVQPAALARGLAAALPANVELFEESPVHEVRRESDIHLECAEGSVNAKHLLLASNGFTPSMGFLKRRLFPLFTFASLTRPLEPDEQAALSGNPEWGLLPSERIGTTVRRTQDNRILIRNSIRYSAGVRIGDDQRRKIRKIHLNSFRVRFPALREVDFQYTWGGVMGMSMNNAQFFGRVAPDVFASAAYNGVGIATGTASGMLLADLAVGSESALLAEIQALPGPAWIPPDPLLGLGVRATVKLMQVRAGAES